MRHNRQAEQITNHFVIFSEIFNFVCDVKWPTLIVFVHVVSARVLIMLAEAFSTRASAIQTSRRYIWGAGRVLEGFGFGIDTHLYSCTDHSVTVALLLLNTYLVTAHHLR
jgi:hypothetical protein